MLDRNQIEKAAGKAGEVAYSILGLECGYSIRLIDDRNNPLDAQLDTSKLEIQINLSKLEPFPPEIAGTEDEDYRHHLKICYLVFHEMRHIYQIQAVNVYTINEQLGSHMLQPLESDKKAALWLKEMKDSSIPPESSDTEADANAFAYYLTNRYPIPLKMAQTNQRIGVMKRKYNKIPIPEIYENRI